MFIIITIERNTMMKPYTMFGNNYERNIQVAIIIKKLQKKVMARNK